MKHGASKSNLDLFSVPFKVAYCTPIQDAYSDWQVSKDLEQDAASVNLLDENYVRKSSERMPDFGRKMEYLLNTGNLVSKSGLDLSQSTGFTVVAEKLNFFRHDLPCFRCHIHFKCQFLKPTLHCSHPRFSESDSPQASTKLSHV